MRNQLTALSALASVLRRTRPAAGTPRSASTPRCRPSLVGDMVDSVNAFLDGPFGDSGGGVRAPRQRVPQGAPAVLPGGERWAAEGKRLAVRDL